jgi:tRNA pseudouridine38-40 synthase
VSHAPESTPPDTTAFGVLLRVAYDGRRFSGFARQTHERTVAGELDGAVRAVDPRASLVRGASRTDAGVHARDQVVAFDARQSIPSRGWVHALNRHLGEDAAVVGAARVAPGYDPRQHAVAKTYRYLVLCAASPDPFLVGRAWPVRERLNHARMRAALDTIVGTHDFGAFRSSADERTETVRRILRATVAPLRDDARCLAFDVCGSGFMHRMVRIIVGSAVDIGRERLDADAFTRAIASGRRQDLGLTAPPDGLYLERIELDDRGEDEWPDRAPED